MDYGVTITRGAKPWQIFQQTDGFADIALAGRYRRIRLSQELPLEFSEIPDRPVTVKARVAWESSGESVLPWQLCEVRPDGAWSTDLKHIPAGGLYRIETYMEYEGWDGLSCTRGDIVHNLGVGDIFVITGQSNAAGRAKTPIEDAPELGVHLLRCSGEWDLATHPLAEATKAVHLGNYANHNPGHNGWLHFAKILKRELGYPIGLVNCAYGGAPLRWWNPEQNGSLFRNMLAMLGDYDITPRAAIWYQGETECYDESDAGETYLARFGSYVRHMREELHSPELPFITVQVNRFLRKHTAVEDRTYGLVRDAQRRAMHELPYVYTVQAADLALYDCGHNAAESDLVLGERCAKCALTELYGKHYNWRAPEPVCARLTAPDTVELTLAPVINDLQFFELIPEKLPFDAEDAEGLVRPREYHTEGDDKVVIAFERELGPDARLHGAWRMDSGGIVPYDCMRTPILSFYGFPIEKS